MSRSLRLLAPALLSVAFAGCDPADSMPPPTLPTAHPSPSPAAPPPSPAPAPAPSPAPPEPAALEEARAERPRRSVTATADGPAASAHAAFALDLAGTLRQRPGNQVTSPASISIALAMAAAGARGETATAMLQALRRPGGAERLHTEMNLLDAELANRGAGAKGATGGAFALRTANRVWAQRGYAFEAPFLETLAEHYGAGVGLVDFVRATEPARQTINGWVSGRTETRIRELIPPMVLTTATRMVLTNAVYLDAAWAVPFEPHATSDGPFVREDGSESRGAFMRRRAALASAQGEGWVAAALPFADPRLEMIIIVPDSGTFAPFAAGFDATKLGQITGALAPRDTALVLPRFGFETAISVKESLTAMGMARAFDGTLADFSGINGSAPGAEKLFIGDVLHKAFIAVNERGTEAAAATAVELGAGAAPPSKVPPLLVNANRPFFFVLRDQPTGAVLFLGRVMDPIARAGH